MTFNLTVWYLTIKITKLWTGMPKSIKKPQLLDKEWYFLFLGV